jgi:hypothetical protein
MPCMCGDTHCWSCGPAQGNFKCAVCGVWADDGCEHLDEVTSQVKPEYQAAWDRALAEEAAAELELEKIEDAWFEGPGELDEEPEGLDD